MCSWQGIGAESTGKRTWQLWYFAWSLPGLETCTGPAETQVSPTAGIPEEPNRARQDVAYPTSNRKKRKDVGASALSCTFMRHATSKITQ